MQILTNGGYKDMLGREAQTLAETSNDDLALEIPHIEGWTVQSVIGHIGWIFRYATAALEAPADKAPARSAIPEPPTSDTVVAWMGEGASRLLARLAETDPESIHATFTGPQPASWWLRRITHETAMHRWDVQSAIGSASPFDPILAIDGVDEVLDIFVPGRMQFDSLAGQGETVHLHATDVDGQPAGAGEWVLTYAAETIEWKRAHEKCDVAARGPASDLLLMLWSRIPPSRLELFGDATLLDRWQRAANF